MVVVVVLFEIVRIICGDERDPHLLMHLEEFLVHDLLVSDAVAHDLEVVAIAEERLKVLRHRPGLVRAPFSFARIDLGTGDDRQPEVQIKPS